MITSLLFAMLGALSDDQIDDGNIMFTIAQRLGGSIGVGVLGSFLAARSAAVGAVAAFHETALALTVTAAAAAALALRLASPHPSSRQPADAAQRPDNHLA
ncbi:hypothetical protein AB0K00_52440 [Dactylosporangium sp. NPDC049525]|uniref:hypothetical protein n=1 Tax=Dactylosporangium sp. NPDC049525 TaxID=3154730 RepID=UPI0034123A1F